MPVLTAERKRPRFKETLSQLNKERRRRGGAHERELHNQLSHKVGQNISAAPTDSTPFLLSFFFSVFDTDSMFSKDVADRGKNTVIIGILITGVLARSVGLSRVKADAGVRLWQQQNCTASLERAVPKSLMPVIMCSTGNPSSGAGEWLFIRFKILEIVSLCSRLHFVRLFPKKAIES